MGGEVFVSYSRRSDGRYVDELAAYLASAGFRTWYDRQITPGAQWSAEIRRHIDTCAAFVVVMTPEAEASQWVDIEVERARESRRPILPLLLRGERFFALANIQHEDVVGGRMPGERFVSRLRDAVADAARAGLLERDADLNRCSAVLKRLRAGTGATIVIEGSAGIGKSEIARRVCAEAAVRRIVPLSVQCSERDQSTAFAAARQLLTRWVKGLDEHERVRVLADAAALAAVPLGLPDAPRAGPAAAIGLTEALYWLVVNATALLAADQREDGLLLAVDDAHWLDEETLTWLGFLTDRLADLPVAVLLAYRPDQSQTVPALLQITLRATEVIRPRALTRYAVSTLVEDWLFQPPDIEFCEAILQRSGGNPFYLRWMLQRAHERGLLPTTDGAEQISQLTPRHVITYLNERLQRLGPDAKRLAQTVAVLSAGSSLEQAARLAGLPVDDAKLHYDRLCHAEILARGPRVDFCHPIIRSAVYDDIEPSVRSDTHLAAARMLHDQQVGADAVAAHLLDVLTCANPWAVEQLNIAAAEAMASGLPGTAARYLKRAVEEPPPASQRCQVRLRYGQALALGPLAQAIPELLQAYRDASEDGLRTEAAIALAKTYSYADRLGDSVRMLDTALARSTNRDSRARLVAEQLLWATWWANDPKRVDRMRQISDIAPTLTGEDHAQRLILMLRAWTMVLRGAPARQAMAAIHPVIASGLAFTNLEEGMEVGINAAFVPMYCGALDLARSLFDQAVDDFQRDGWWGTHLAFARTHQGNVALRQGRLADAIADAEIALRLADRAGDATPAEWFATGTLIQALVATGDAAQATAVDVSRRYGDREPDALAIPMPQAVHGALQIKNGHTAAGITTLRRVGRRLDADGLTNPAWCPWRLDLGSALRQSAPEEAEELLSDAWRLADRFGCASTTGRAIRILAAVRKASTIELLEESVRILSEAPNRLELAKTLAELGTTFARTERKTDAHRRLTEALTIADKCHAHGLRVDIANQLSQAGLSSPSPPTHSNLDPDQRRAALLTAQGQSRAEIAHTMVIDLSTVNNLLEQAYAKLQAGSPAELRQALICQS